jgi:hypothetical protein
MDSEEQPARYRAVLDLRTQGLSFAAIADQLDPCVTPARARQLYQEATKRAAMDRFCAEHGEEAWEMYVHMPAAEVARALGVPPGFIWEATRRVVQACEVARRRE